MIRRTACLIARDNDPFRNLALEKHLLDTLPEETAILYLWRNDRSIIVGRNQNPWQECQVEAFLESGGRIARRLSGGGAVFHDLGNLNFTFLLPKADFNIQRQLAIVVSALRALGVDAQPSGRNDLQVGNQKISGSAFFTSGRGAFHHGTLLVSCDENQMARYLTVDPEKLAARGVQSVRSRVENLTKLKPGITIDALSQQLYYAFGTLTRNPPSMLDERMLDKRSVDQLTQRFSDPEWVYPAALGYTFSVRERLPWGGVTVKLLVRSGMIEKVKLFTDSMETSLFERIEDALTGSPFLISAVSGRFESKLILPENPSIRQIAADVEQLICSRMRAMDRTPASEEETK